MENIIWNYKPKFEDDISVFNIKKFKTNEEEIFYNVTNSELKKFSDRMIDKRYFGLIYKDIYKKIEQNKSYRIIFDDYDINSIFFFKHTSLIIFNELSLQDIYKNILLVYNTFLNRVYFKSIINIKIIILSTKGVE